MKLYDRNGNVIEVLDYRGNKLNDLAESARVLERRTSQFRLTPALWWASWMGVIIGWTATLVSAIVASVLLSWPAAALAAVMGTASFFSMYTLADYHKRHGMPKTLHEKPVEMYCKSCQTKIENDLEIAKEQRVHELVAELEQLTGGLDQIPALPQPERQAIHEDDKREFWQR